jgi:hypothetical protein
VPGSGVRARRAPSEGRRARGLARLPRDHRRPARSARRRHGRPHREPPAAVLGALRRVRRRLFNQGDYLRAFERKLATERISKILDPSGSTESGQELRLLQEYFFVACALRDILRRYTDVHASIEGLPDAVAIQMNDTHPALAVAELTRMLVDEQTCP